jgi:hypothetical protein
MPESDELLAMRLGYLCDNAENVRTKLSEKHLETLYSALHRDADLSATLEQIGATLELNQFRFWRGSDARGAMADVPNLPSGTVEVRLNCPREASVQCVRSVVWNPDDDADPPSCALTAQVLRWDGNERIAD